MFDAFRSIKYSTHDFCYFVFLLIHFVLFSFLLKRIFQHGTFMNHGMHRRVYKKLPNALLDVVSFFFAFPFHSKLNQYRYSCVFSILSHFFNHHEFSEYSLPMVDHTVASRTNIERLRQVYHQLYKYRDLSMDLHCLLFSYFLVI